MCFFFIFQEKFYQCFQVTGSKGNESTPVKNFVASEDLTIHVKPAGEAESNPSTDRNIFEVNGRNW